MKTYIIGDLHGRIEIVKKIQDILRTDLSAKAVFIGDYLDSYDRPPQECFETLKLVLHLQKAYFGRVEALKGNHELSYMYPYMRSSGFSQFTKLSVDTEIGISTMEEELLDYTFVNGYLISHAGVSSHLLDGMGCSLESYLKKEDFFQIGRVRGGLDSIGGLFWCDWNQEFEPINGIKQIVGHTRGDIIREKDDNYCIDVLHCSDKVLLLEPGKSPVSFDLNLDNNKCN